jgi:hypothetical protein
VYSVLRQSADAAEIGASGPVIENPQTSNNLKPVIKWAAIKGIADEMMVYEIP